MMELTDSELELLSPFELSLHLEKRVKLLGLDKELLNAGRGNPNWTAPIPREAYFLLGLFATQEISVIRGPLVGTMIKDRPGLIHRFEIFLDSQKQTEGGLFLNDIWEHGALYLGASRKQWLLEFLDAIIGDNYPHPERILNYCGQAMEAYMRHEIFHHTEEEFDLFAVEGGSAGICYMFDSLVNNHLLHPGDHIALMIPTFAPYLEIPHLKRYHFDVEFIRAQPTKMEGYATYQFPNSEIDKLKNKSIKAVFVVNPSNPSSNAICIETLEYLKKIVQTDNPKLMILSDDVYGTFVKRFVSIFTILPYNTACIYSYSKYFGATGWRVGLIAIGKQNIYDQLISELPTAEKNKLEQRYESVTSKVSELPFIDRLVADSREVALNHAAGLSTPQQVMMAIFSLYSLLDRRNTYKSEVISVCRKRQSLLYEALGLDAPLLSYDAAYYCEMDYAKWIKRRYDKDFLAYLQKEITITRLLIDLSEQEGLLLLKGSAFGSSDWTIRISLANLPTPAYIEVANRIISLTDLMYQEYKKVNF